MKRGTKTDTRNITFNIIHIYHRSRCVLLQVQYDYL